MLDRNGIEKIIIQKDHYNYYRLELSVQSLWKLVSVCSFSSCLSSQIKALLDVIRPPYDIKCLTYTPNSQTLILYYATQNTL